MAVSGVLFMVGRSLLVSRLLGAPTLPAACLCRLCKRRAGRSSAPAAEAPSAPAAPVRSSSRSRWLLVVCCVAQFMVILDLSIVNVALPRIQTDLGFSSPDLQWVVDAYAITFAGFLMLGGRAADHFGQRRTFVVALAMFGVASLAGGLAPDQATLDRARARCRAWRER